MKLRSGTAYEILVASNGTDGVRQSAWALAPLLRTDRATHAPESPLEPTVLSSSHCHHVRLRLPAPPTGCRSPTEATLQYMRIPTEATLQYMTVQPTTSAPSTSSWVDHDAPVLSREVGSPSYYR
jgi:hypothetical protein